MRIIEFLDDVRVWKRVVDLSFGQGHHITNARLHALQRMIEWRLSFQEHYTWRVGLFDHYDSKIELETMIRLCDFAKSKDVTAAEKQIYLHLIRDICNTLINAAPVLAEPPKVTTAESNGVAADEIPF